MLRNEVVKSSVDLRDYTINEALALPETFSLPVKVPVKNQGSKPTCVAHAAASLVEYHHKIQHDNKYRAFSTEFIYGTRDKGYYVGDGMMIRNALQTLSKYGDPYKTDCPGNNDYEEAMQNVAAKKKTYFDLAYPNRISMYYRVNTVKEIKTALFKHGPVLVSMKTYDNAKIIDDIYTYDSTQNYGHHCVLLYGWDERGWLVQNSWGTKYAGDGRFVLPFDYKFNEGWGVTDNITDTDINVKNLGPIVTTLIKLCNTVINWIYQLFN